MLVIAAAFVHYHWIIKSLNIALFQIFHVLVIAAAFVHYHGMADMAVYR